MNIFGGLFLFLLLFVFSLEGDYLSKEKRTPCLVLIVCLVLFMLANRDPKGWIDTVTYGKSFMNTTKTLSTFSFSDRPFGYTEKGYYFLCVLAKTISNTYFFYFLFIGSISLFFIYKSLQKYSLLPILGFFVYAGRFLLGRDFNQMRSGVAIAIIIFATYYLTKKKALVYLLFIILAFTIHTSVLVALPFYFINKYRFNKWQIVVGLVIAFLIAGIWGGTVKSIVSGSYWAQELAASYIEEGSVKAWENDLRNPMIYYQCIILLFYSFMENPLSKLSIHYYTFRNAYFYSTLLLIVLCQYGIVAGRTSTVFATYEMIMIPMIVVGVGRKQRFIPYILILIFGLFFFIKNWPGTNFGL